MVGTPNLKYYTSIQVDHVEELEDVAARSFRQHVAEYLNDAPNDAAPGRSKDC